MAATILAVFLWKITDLHLIALSWLGAGFVFFETGRRYSRHHLRLQAHLVLFLSLVVVSAFNLRIIPYQGWPPSGAVPALCRIVGPSIAVFAYVYCRAGFDWRPPQFSRTEQLVGHYSSAIVTALMGLFLRREVVHSIVALSWLALALLIFELGNRLTQPLLRTQAYVLLSIAFLGLLSINLYEFYPLTGPAVTDLWQVICLAAIAFYYVIWRLLTASAPNSYRWVLLFSRSESGWRDLVESCVSTSRILAAYCFSISSNFAACRVSKSVAVFM
ncbi:MAG: hypothetical protein ACR2PG_16365 [Hyphomicrobiaceae bacterium]